MRRKWRWRRFSQPHRPAALLSQHDRGRRREIKAGINQFLDNTSARTVGTAIQSNLLAEAELDKVIKGTLRVFILLGLLDPTNTVPYASIGAPGEPEPCTTEKHKARARLVTQKSIVLLKNSKKLLPLDKTKLKSIRN